MTSTLTPAERAELWDRRGEVFVAALQESRRSDGRGFGREGAQTLSESEYLWENRGRLMLGGERLEAALVAASQSGKGESNPGTARAESTQSGPRGRVLINEIWTGQPNAETISCTTCKDASKSPTVESICPTCGL